MQYYFIEEYLLLASFMDQLMEKYETLHDT